MEVMEREVGARREAEMETVVARAPLAEEAMAVVRMVAMTMGCECEARNPCSRSQTRKLQQSRPARHLRTPRYRYTHTGHCTHAHQYLVALAVAAAVAMEVVA
jgi:hypothetical protein